MWQIQVWPLLNFLDFYPSISICGWLNLRMWKLWISRANYNLAQGQPNIKTVTEKALILKFLCPKIGH